MEATMHIRFVRLKGKEEKVWDARKFYEDNVLPNLDEIDGCLFAGLLQGTIHGDDYISMTVWTNVEAAETYERGGLFDRLLDESDEALQGVQELPADLAGAPDAVIFSGIEPEVETWDVVGTADEQILDKVSQGRVFVRMVAARLRRGAFDAFQRRFDDEVRPALAATPGCLGSYLVVGAGDQTRILSVTMWAREEDAVRYGLSGEFERLTERLKDTFSDLYQWSIALSGDPEPTTEASSRGVDVEGYQLVVGRKLK
jgi:heme-degrading monooxygenase HmoA